MKRTYKHTCHLDLILRIAIVFGCFCLASCSGSSVAGFQWKSADGRPQAFGQQSSFPEGSEGLFSASRPSNVYVLRKAIVAGKGEMLAAKLRLETPNLLVTFRYGDASGDSTGAMKEVRFAPSKGETTFYLSLSPGERLSICGVAIDASKADVAGLSPEPEGKEPPLAQIQWLAILPAFQGYESLEDGGCRLSDGFSYMPDSHTAIWSIKQAGQGDPSGGQPAQSSPAAQLATIGQNVVPALVVKYAKAADADITVMAGTRFKARCTSPTKGFLIPLEEFSLTQEVLRLRIPDTVSVEAAYVERIPAEQARVVDPGLLLSLPTIPTGADYNYYRWDILPKVLIFDFKNYAAQDEYLKRLAFYVEKKGFAGKLASDSEIAPLHGWNAHDYRSEDLAAFFSETRKQNFPLNDKEKALRDFLVDQKLIARDGQGYKGLGGAIISLSQESPSYLRHTFLTHESSHAIFFVDEEYRSFCVSMWNSMSDKEKWFWYLYFGWMNYDISSAYLMANEMQAYLMQQPYSGAEKYFTTTPVNRMLEHHPELKGKLDEYMAAYGSSFAAHAMDIQNWLEKRYGFAPGTTYFLR